MNFHTHTNKEVTQMTIEQLNTALYQKMFAEQEKYKAWLLSQTPEAVLDHAYEDVCCKG